mgnify:FL=1
MQFDWQSARRRRCELRAVRMGDGDYWIPDRSVAWNYLHATFNPMKLSDAFTIQQAATKLGITPAYCLTLARQYGLARHKFGGSYILTEDDIDILRARPSYGSRRSRRYDRHGKPQGEAR